MAYKNASYTPNAESARVLDRAWEHIQSVPYKATARWLFYRLLQDGFYSAKNDYKKKFLPLFSRARHNNYKQWRPDTLADDMRSAIDRAGGHRNTAEWARAIAERGVSCTLDHWYSQDCYVELWFEAAAMVRQFDHYTHGITLRPFGGMPSIDYKYSAAKAIERAAERYKLPVVILYFGDYDPQGLTIPETTVNDIRGWCGVEFRFVRAGLNEGDAERYNIPENFEKPGAYQWEALEDTVARELITGSVAQYVDTSKVDQARREAWAAEKTFESFVSGFYESFMQP